MIKQGLRMVCRWLLAAALPLTLQAAQGDICENMTGEQLRRCIENSAREAPKANTPAAAAPAARPTSRGNAVIPPAPSGTVSQSREATELQRRDCTKVPQPDQTLCVYRNTALLECATPGRHADRDKCLTDLMSRAPNPAIADCSRLPQSQHELCFRRNKVYASCKGDKLGYFACLDTQLAGGK